MCPYQPQTAQLFATRLPALPGPLSTGYALRNVWIPSWPFPPGIRATKKLISDHSVWPGLHWDLALWVWNCSACQTSKVYRHMQSQQTPFVMPRWCFDHVHIHIVGKLPESSDPICLLTCVVRFSGGKTLPPWEILQPRPSPRQSWKARMQYCIVVLYCSIAEFTIPFTIPFYYSITIHGAFLSTFWFVGLYKKVLYTTV